MFVTRVTSIRPKESVSVQVRSILEFIPTILISRFSTVKKVIITGIRFAIRLIGISFLSVFRVRCFQVGSFFVIVVRIAIL